MKTWIYISLAGLTLLVTLLGFLFGTDIVGRFSQPETRAERRVHATYSLKQAPFVHPQIIGDLIGILSDVGDQVVAINLLDSQDSNRYFGKIFVTPQTDPLVPSWPWVSTRNRDLNKDEEGGDFPRQEYHAYRYLGLTLSGLEVLHTQYSGGGSSVFNRLVFVKIEADYGAEYPLLRNIDSGSSATEPKFRNRELIKIVGKIPLGDRWRGTVEVVRDDVVVRGRDLFERCKLGGVSKMEAIEMKFFMDIDCRASEPDHPPSARVYKAPVQRQ